MSLPKIPFHVRATNCDAELFLVDSDFGLVGERGLSEKTWDVEPGPYIVKARRGTAIFEKVFLVRPGAKEFVIPHIAFASPSPIPGTVWTHEHHIAADRDAATRDPDVTHGKGGSAIVIMVREWTEKEKSGDPPALNPARGLSLLTLDGTSIVDLNEPPHKDYGWQPWATCHVAVEPGAYRLRLDRDSVEMILIASPGFQTHVYLLTETARRRDERRADLGNGTISLRRRDDWDDPKKKEEIWQLEELVRQALVDDRSKICPFVESQIKREDATPMLALYGAHVLVNDVRRQKIKRENDQSVPEAEIEKRAEEVRVTVAGVVQRLREVLGNEHPDVEALAFGAGVARPDFRFTVPPMLRGGWLRVLSESSQRDNIADDSFSHRIGGRLWGDGPWLMWNAPEIAESYDRDAAWMERANALLAEFLQKNPDVVAQTEAAPQAWSDTFRSYVSAVKSRLTSPNLPAFPEASAVMAQQAAERPPLDVAAALEFLDDPENCKRVVKHLGLPAATIREWLHKLARPA